MCVYRLFKCPNAKWYLISFRVMRVSHLTKFQILQLKARKKAAISTEGDGHCMLHGAYAGLSFDCASDVRFPDYIISFFNTFCDYCREAIKQGIFDCEQVPLETLLEQVHRFVFHCHYDAEIVDHALLVLCNEFRCKIEVIEEKVPVKSVFPENGQPVVVSVNLFPTFRGNFC